MAERTAWAMAPHGQPGPPELGGWEDPSPDLRRRLDLSFRWCKLPCSWALLLQPQEPARPFPGSRGPGSFSMTRWRWAGPGQSLTGVGNTPTTYL